MKLYGLTGGIASGKSTAAKFFRQEGAIVIDADQLARDAVAPGTEGLRGLRDHFGEKILASEGTLDRKKLGKIIFDAPEERQWVNQWLHPKIAVLAAQTFAHHREKGEEHLIYEVPLLFEAKMQDMFDATILVSIPEKLQRERLCQREDLTPAQASKRIEAQMPLHEKAQRADHILDNQYTLERLQQQVQQLWRKLTNKGS